VEEEDLVEEAESQVKEEKEDEDLKEEAREDQDLVEKEEVMEEIHRDLLSVEEDSKC